jgi:hypothetical protein
MVLQKEAEQMYMPFVLLDRRGDTDVFLAIINLEFSLAGDLKLIGIILGFKNVNVKHPIDQEVINLSNLPPMLKP